MDRLLSAEQVSNILKYRPVTGYIKESIIDLIKAQDAKTASIVRKEVNEEWVKWIEDNAAYSYFTDGKRITINVAKWQARKKECGL